MKNTGTWSKPISGTSTRENLKLSVTKSPQAQGHQNVATHRDKRKKRTVDILTSKLQQDKVYAEKRFLV